MELDLILQNNPKLIIERTVLLILCYQCIFKDLSNLSGAEGGLLVYFYLYIELWTAPNQQLKQYR